jgi:hypothetical protein
MNSNYLDWERKFKKYDKKKKKYSVYEAIFLKKLSYIQPIKTKSKLKEEIMKTGISEVDFSKTYENLKNKKILKYSIELNGFYAELEVIKEIEMEYNEPVKKSDSIEIDFKDSKKTIDEFTTVEIELEEKKELTKISDENLKEIKKWKKNHSH